MPDMDKSPLESAVGAVDPETVEASKLVGNETRLAILLVLWKAYDRPDATDNAVSFTRLFEQFDYGERGNFRALRATSELVARNCLRPSYGRH